MKYFFKLMVFVGLFTIAFAGEKNWIENSVFGIKINWGLQAIPAWSPKNRSILNYQRALEKRIIDGDSTLSGNEIFEYHKKRYGAHFSYYNFGELFNPMFFNGTEWIELIKNSGATYVIFPAKSGDGFCLWPNKQANDRGFPWNSASMGAKRDFVGEFTNAIRKTDLKFGLSYAVDEEFHPLFNSDKSAYKSEHFHPQIKDMLGTYQPDLIYFSDNASEMKYDSIFEDYSKLNPNFIFNEPTSISNVENLVNYPQVERKTLEINFGINSSMGYNLNNDLSDFLSARELVLLMSEMGSRGGNFLLTIGADENGKIPLIVQERLVSIGKWLKINGEALNGTKAWEVSHQWTLGKIDTIDRYTAKEILENINSVNISRAKKEILFTQKGTDLYAICPQYPGEELVIYNVELPENGYVQFFATQQKPNWYNKDGNLHIKTPQFVPEILKNEMTYAYVFKLGNAITEKTEIQDVQTVQEVKEIEKVLQPEVSVSYAKIDANPIITVQNKKDSKIFYTLDGTLPDTNSFVYTVPFSIDKSARIKLLFKNYSDGKDFFLEKFVKVIKEFSELKLVYPPEKAYAGHGPITLCDGIYGDMDQNSGKWLGFHGKDLIAEIKLSSERFISSVTVSVLHKPSDNIYFPREFEIYTSLDDENFEYLKKLEITEFPEKEIGKKLILEVPLQQAKSIRIFVKNYGRLPELLDGQPQEAWLFVDEIEVR